MQEGTFSDTIYIITWTEPYRAEGGPIVTRHAKTPEEADKIWQRAMDGPDQHGPTVHRQTSLITRERIR